MPNAGLHLAPRPKDPELFKFSPEVIKTEKLVDPSIDRLASIKQEGALLVDLSFTSVNKDIICYLSKPPFIENIARLSVSFSEVKESEFKHFLSFLEACHELTILSIENLKLLNRSVCDKFCEVVRSLTSLNSIELDNLTGFEDIILNECLKSSCENIEYVNSNIQEFNSTVPAGTKIICSSLDLSDNPLQISAFYLIYLLQECEFRITNIKLANCSLFDSFVNCLLDIICQEEIKVQSMVLSNNFLTSSIIKRLDCSLISVRSMDLSNNYIDKDIYHIFDISNLDEVNLSMNFIQFTAEELNQIKMHTILEDNLTEDRTTNELVVLENEHKDFAFEYFESKNVEMKITMESLVYHELDSLFLMQLASRTEHFGPPLTEIISSFTTPGGVSCNSFVIDRFMEQETLDALASAYLPLLPNLKILDVSERDISKEIGQICCELIRRGYFQMFDFSGIKNNIILQGLIRAASGNLTYLKLGNIDSIDKIFSNLNEKAVDFSSLEHLDLSLVEECEEVRGIISILSSLATNSNLKIYTGFNIESTKIEIIESYDSIEDDVFKSLDAINLNCGEVIVELKNSSMKKKLYNENTLELTTMFPQFMSQSTYISMFDSEEEISACEYTTYRGLELDINSSEQNNNSLSPQVELAASHAKEGQNIVNKQEATDKTTNAADYIPELKIDMLKEEEPKSQQKCVTFQESETVEHSINASASDYSYLNSRLSEKVELSKSAERQTLKISLEEQIQKIQNEGSYDEEVQMIIDDSSDEESELEKQLADNRLEYNEWGIAQQTEQVQQLEVEALEPLADNYGIDDVLSMSKLNESYQDFEQKIQELSRKEEELTEIMQEELKLEIHNLYLQLETVKEEICEEFYTETAFNFTELFLFSNKESDISSIKEVIELVMEKEPIPNELDIGKEQTKEEFEKIQELQEMQIDEELEYEAVAKKIVQVIILSDIRDVELDCSINSFEGAEFLFEQLEIRDIEGCKEHIACQCKERLEIVRELVELFDSIADIVQAVKDKQNEESYIKNKMEDNNVLIEGMAKQFDYISEKEMKAANIQLSKSLEQLAETENYLKHEYANQHTAFIILRDKVREFGTEKIKQQVLELCSEEKALKILNKIELL